MCVSLFLHSKIYACVCVLYIRFSSGVCENNRCIVSGVFSVFFYCVSLFFLWLLLCLAIGWKGEKQDRGFLALDWEDGGRGWVVGEGQRDDGGMTG